MVNNLATSPSFIANSTACRHLAITPLLVQSQTRNPPTCFQFHRCRFHGIDRLGHLKSYTATLGIFLPPGRLGVIAGLEMRAADSDQAVEGERIVRREVERDLESFDRRFGIASIDVEPSA